ncbi:hypothetical protein Tco_0194128 [Tanacetum coccineum]
MEMAEEDELLLFSMSCVYVLLLLFTKSEIGEIMVFSTMLISAKVTMDSLEANIMARMQQEMVEEDALLAFQCMCSLLLFLRMARIQPWNTYEKDTSSKKFLVGNFTNYKMSNLRPVMEQYNELLGILGRFTQYKINMDEAIQASCIIDKLPSSWKDFKHTLKHKKEELTLVELDSHLRIKESFRVHDSDKPKGNNVAGPLVVNMVEHNNFIRY